MTSRSGQKHRDEAHALGARDYLTKPFNQEVLGRMVRKWAPRGGHAAELRRWGRPRGRASTAASPTCGS